MRQKEVFKMAGLTDLLYIFVLGLIEFYKLLELQVLKFFKPILIKKGVALAESIGVVCHLPGDGKNDPKWIAENESRILRNSRKKYDKLIHLKISDPDKVFLGITNRGTICIGETFMDGTWTFSNDDSEVSEFLARVLENDLMNLYWTKWNRFLDFLALEAFNLQTKNRAFQVGKEHYDLGNDLYEQMLDPWMQYTCGYWPKTKNLDEAQLHKLELIAKKLDLQPGMRVLDIGCGWGTLCKYLAENYEVECVGVTISEEGVAYGQKINEGLPVDIRLQDYRDVNEKFDRVVSIGCMEHVGFKNYAELMDVAGRCLKDDEGIFLLHTIGRNHANMPRSDRWFHKYIFPNGNLPEPLDIAKVTKGRFIIEDWHNFGPDYVKTLEGWLHNFKTAWPTLRKKYDKGRFYKMWFFYLSMAIGLFKSRRLQLWQIALTKDGIKTREYRAAR